MAKKLTAKAIENLRPAPQRREVSDGGSGLWVIVQPSGAKSFAVRYRHAGKPAKMTLGGWPAVSLAAARKEAADALHRLAQGIDPSEARKAAKQRTAESEANTVAAICKEFLQREGKRLRTIDQRERTLRRLVYPTIGERPIESLKRSEIVRLLDRIEDTSGPRMADVTLGVLRRIFNWHALRSDEFRSPIIRGMGRINPAEHRRSRILDDDELRRLWAATADGQPFSDLVRFLLLTSARRGEAAAMTWGEIADGVWTLPASRSKTKAEVVRPLSQASLAIIEAQPRNGLPWVFTTTGVGPLRSFSDPKAKLDAASGVASYRIHDIRRTARSLLSRAGVSPDVAERCLGHAMPTIRATYDRHRYVEEMRHAFEALAALIERIVDPSDAVIPLRR